MRILVVEDDPVSLKLLERWLTRRGHEIVAARNGEEGWEQLQTQKFSIVISDWMMPKCDGVELCGRIRSEQGGSYVYFILQTAKSEKSDLVEAFDKGVDDFLRKPLALDELSMRLRVAERILKSEERLAETLKEMSRSNERMRNDLEAAAKIQHSLLPDENLEVPGIRWKCAYLPCDEVAGDTMNIFRLDETRVGVYVLDVSGHGVPAALFAVSLSQILSPNTAVSQLLKRRISEPPYYEVVQPGAVTGELNNRFPMNPETCQYFTMAYAIYDRERRNLRYSLAGHPHPILIVPGEKPRMLEQGDAPIGFVPDMKYGEADIEIPAGSRLYLYTDGILELPSESGEFFREERLVQCVQASAGRDLGEAVQSVLDELRSWVGEGKFPDDVSIMAFEVD